jgi:hypothetical protein
MEPFNNVRAWEKDADAAVCRRCRIPFDWTNWRHHCRSCGRVLCDVCSCHYVLVPYDELCPNAPTSVNLKEPQRACWECAQRIRGRQQVENGHTNINGQYTLQRQDQSWNHIHTVDAMGFDRRQASKLYLVRLPEQLQLDSNRVIGVEIGGRICHVRVPLNIRPGDSFYLRANDAHIIARQASDYIFTEVYIVNVESLCEMMNEQNDPYSTRGGTVTTPPQNQSPTRSTPSAAAIPTPAAVADRAVRAVPARADSAEEPVMADAFIQCPACTYHNSLRATNCAMCDSGLS